MCMETPYEHVKRLVGDQMDAFVRQWNTEGIIYEYDFGISSVMIEHQWSAIVQVLEEAGCDVTNTMYMGVEVNQEGCMYAGFDCSRYTYKEAEQMIKRKFGQKNP